MILKDLRFAQIEESRQDLHEKWTVKFKQKYCTK